MKIMASGLITSWQIDEETMETVRDFIFLGSKITADDDCSHDMKRQLAPWKKSYDQSSSVQFSRSVVSDSLPRQCIKKQRHYFTLPTKVHLVKAMVFPVLMYGCCMLDHKEG